jgi:hypothetical protein
LWIFDEDFWEEFERITFTRALPGYVVCVAAWLLYLVLTG